MAIKSRPKYPTSPAPIGNYTSRPGYVPPNAPIDPRMGNRWQGTGAIGRFLPGPQSPFPKPRPQDYNVQHPSEYAPFVDWSQVPQNAFKGDEQLSPAVDFLGDWDYKKPPTDPMTGAQLGPDLKPLPEGALGFTPTGDPYWGEGLKGWWNGFSHRMTEGGDPNWQENRPGANDEPIAQYILNGDWGGALNATGNFFGDIGYGFQNVGTTEEGDVSPLTFASRLVKEGVGGTLNLFNQGAIGAKRYLGTVGESLENLGEGSPLPEFTRIDERFTEFAKNNAWIPDWSPGVLETFANMTPGGIAYNSIRALTAPPRSWDEVKDVWKDNYQASRAAYSLFGNEALKQEYIRRYKQGDDPALLAMELQSPWAEAVGELVVDPLNFVGLVAKGLKSEKTIATLTDEFLKVAPDIEDALKIADDVSDADRAARLTTAVTAKIAENAKIASNLDDLAQNRGLLALTTDGKRFQVGRRASELVSYITRNSATAEDAIETFRAMVMMAGDNADEVGTGLTIAKNFPAPRALLGRAGSELGITMRAMMTDAEGVFDASKFFDELATAKEKGVEAVIELANSKTKRAIDDLYPTVLEQVEAGKTLKLHEAGKLTVPLTPTQLTTLTRQARLGEVSPFTEAISRFDFITKSKIYQPINRFYAGVYMGLSPGYAFRNGISNMTHVFLDRGLGAWGKGTVSDATKWIPRTEKWLAGHLPAGVTGFGEAAVKGLDVGKGGKWYEIMTKLSGKLEERAAMRVVGHAVEEAMLKMLQPGRALPDIAPLLERGVSKEAAGAMLSSIVDNFGDVDAAEKVFREMVADGHIDVFKTLNWVSDDTYNGLRGVQGLYDEVAEAARLAASPEDFNARLNQVYAGIESDAAPVMGEKVGFTAENENFREMAAIADANQQDKVLGDALGNVTNNRYIANANTGKAYTDALKAANAQAYRAIKDAGGDFEAADKLGDDLVFLIERNKGAIQNESWKFTQEVVVPWYQKIKSTKTGDWSAMWRAIGIEGEPPPALTKQQLIDTLWQQHFLGTQKQRWSTFRNWQAAVSEAHVQKLAGMAPVDPNGALWTFARQQLKHAQALDEATMSGEYLTRVSHVINESLRKGDEAGAIRALASHYGIATASAKGVPYDNHLLSLLRKYGGAEGAPLSIANLSETNLREVQQILEARLRAKAGENYAPLIENLDEWLGIKPQAIIDEAAETATKTSVPFKYDEVTPIDEITKATGLPERVVKVWQSKLLYEKQKLEISRLSIDAAQKKVLLEEVSARLKGVGMEFSAAIKENKLTRNEVYALLEPERLTKTKLPGQVANAIIPPAHNPEISPTLPRVMHESLPGIKKMLDEIAAQAPANWGRLAPINMYGKEEAVAAYFAKAKEGVSEARLLASQYGNAARKFTLHDYPSKRNIDLAAAYVYPYSFWYSRTYKNSLTRLATNAGTVAAYAKYRDLMAQIHAGAPEWWKYNVNSNELLGLNSENPLFFNLEATLNPMQGITGVDFTDPLRRVNWWTKTVDDMGKFGPSVWTPFSVATAVALYAKGEEDAAARFAGRIIPQTGTLRSLGAVFGANIEADPFVHLFSGGMDVYERRRVGRALGTLYKNGDITQEQMIDAAYFQGDDRYPDSKATWDAATMTALDKRKYGQLSSFLFGVGFKARDTSDISIDQMYSEYFRLWEGADLFSPEQFKQQMSSLRERYPFMDAVLLAKKAGPDRDRALAYNVLGRIPPGQSGDITELVGIDKGLMEQFYANKGDMSSFNPTDRDRFMAGIVDAGALFKLPEYATRQEWDAARSTYQQMQAQGEAMFGADIWDRVDRYYAAKGSDQESRDLADSILKNEPMIEAALDWKSRAIEQTPLLMQYYGGIEFLEQAWKGRMYQQAGEVFGENIFDLQTLYFEAKDHEAALVEQYVAMKLQDPATAKDFYANYLKKGMSPTDMFLTAYPQVDNYWDWKDNQEDVIANRLDTFREIIVEPQGVQLRTDVQNPSLFQQTAMQTINPQPGRTWQQYQMVISDPLQRTLMRYYSGTELPDAAVPQLEQIAKRYGMSVDDLLFDVQRALYENVAPQP